MTSCILFNMAKLSCRGTAFAPKCLNRICRQSLYLPQRSVTLSSVLRRSSTADTNSSVPPTRRRVRRKRPRPKLNRQFVPEHREPAVSVLAEMLDASDTGSSHNDFLNTARTEVDETLQELENIASIQIRDIDLAVETEDETTEDEPDMKTEVRVCGANYDH